MKQRVRGWKRHAAFRPDLILLDLVMPQLDGAEVAAQVESDWALLGVPIVFVTGLGLRANGPGSSVPSSAHLPGAELRGRLSTGGREKICRLRCLKMGVAIGGRPPFSSFAISRDKEMIR